MRNRWSFILIELFDKAIIPIDQIVDWARPGCCTGTVSIRDNAITDNTTARDQDPAANKLGI